MWNQRNLVWKNVRMYNLRNLLPQENNNFSYLHDIYKCDISSNKNFIFEQRSNDGSLDDERMLTTWQSVFFATKRVFYASA